MERWCEQNSGANVSVKMRLASSLGTMANKKAWWPRRLHVEGENVKGRIVASKYAKVFPRLKQLPVQDPTYQQQVDVVKDEILKATEPLHTDDVIHAQVDLILEDIADNVKELVTLLVNAPQGRHHGSVFGRYWLELRRAEDSIFNQLKSVRLLMAAMEQLGVAQFEAEATDRIAFEDLGAVSARPEVVISVHDKDLFRKWCVEANLFRELNMHHGTAQSLTRARLLDGNVEPDGVTAFVHTKFTK